MRSREQVLAKVSKWIEAYAWLEPGSAAQAARKAVGEDAQARRTELPSAAISVVGREAATTGPAFGRAAARISLKVRVYSVHDAGRHRVPARPSETAGREWRQGDHVGGACVLLRFLW